MVKIYSRYDTPPKDGIEFVELSMTQQQFMDECDINNIMAKYRVTGILPQIASDLAAYGDFSDVGDYRSALESLSEADSAFMALPATVRRDFDNNPALLLDFLNRLDDDAVFDKAASYGLLSEEAVSARLATRQPASSTNVAPSSIESPSSESKA